MTSIFPNGFLLYRRGIYFLENVCDKFSPHNSFSAYLLFRRLCILIRYAPPIPTRATILQARNRRCRKKDRSYALPCFLPQQRDLRAFLFLRTPYFPFLLDDRRALFDAVARDDFPFAV